MRLFFLKVYQLFTGITSFAYSKSFKERAEFFYWRIQKLKDSKLGNDHYAYFYTSFFGLDPEFYNHKKVLDIGCGPRGSLDWVAEPDELIGLDPLVDKYKKLKVPRKMKLQQGVAEQIPFADSYFDIITAFNALDHVDDPAKAVAEIYTKLKPGGLFMCILELHNKPTITEPSGISHQGVTQLMDQFIVLQEAYYKKSGGIYASLRQKQEVDPAISSSDYTICVLKALKPG